MKKILIVDDDRDVFESMKIVLEAEGYGVDWAVNGTEAIDKARSGKPDLMILDVMMRTLLIEIGCEELPYKVCESVIRQLEGDGENPRSGPSPARRGAPLRAGQAGTRVLVSPRRVAVLVEGVPERQTARTDDFRGPKAEVAFGAGGELTKAGLGFARSRGAQPGDVRREVDDGTEFAVVHVEPPRVPATDVLPGLLAKLVTGLQIPRGMRWGCCPQGEDDYLRFCGPSAGSSSCTARSTWTARSTLSPFGDVSQGHRVLGCSIIVDTADHYERHLIEQKVVVSQHERRSLIAEGLDARASELGGEWFDPGDVLAENLFLVEWPSVENGRIDERHLRLPAPVLITAMQSHQRARRCATQTGGCCLCLSLNNINNADPAAAELITHGNERVLGGRLDDAEFVYDRDVAEGLEAMACRLGAPGVPRRSSARWPTRRLACKDWWRASRPLPAAARPPAATAPRRRSSRRCSPPPRGWPRPTW